MYIRRKVFSTYVDEYGEERLYSSNEFIDEVDYLSELMYSKNEESHVGKNIALGTAGAVGAAGAGIYGAKKVGQKMVKDNDWYLRKPKTWKRAFNKSNRKKVKVGKNLQKPADFIVETSKKGGKNIAKVAKTKGGKTALIAVPATALAGYGIYKATED